MPQNTGSEASLFSSFVVAFQCESGKIRALSFTIRPHVIQSVKAIIRKSTSHYSWYRMFLML